MRRADCRNSGQIIRSLQVDILVLEMWIKEHQDDVLLVNDRYKYNHCIVKVVTIS